MSNKITEKPIINDLLGNDYIFANKDGALRQISKDDLLKGFSDGTTPHIGENGNWFIGDEDTGVKAEGKDGDNASVPSWVGETKPSYTAREVGADAAGTAQTKVSEHNTAENTHNDIRLLIQSLTNRLNTLANSDDVTLDQMAEVVAYIKNNKSLIDAITTGKVSVGDIIDNLTTSVADRPLSAKQGVVLKGLIDEIKMTLEGITVPTKLSDLNDDSTHRTVTDAEKQTWNSKANQDEVRELTKEVENLKNTGGGISATVVDGVLVFAAGSSARVENGILKI